MRNGYERTIQPAEQPVDLVEILIRTGCPPGGLVGDWFARSGAAGETCRATGRHALGCEVDAAMARHESARIAVTLPLGGLPNAESRPSQPPVGDLP